MAPFNTKGSGCATYGKKYSITNTKMPKTEGGQTGEICCKPSSWHIAIQSLKNSSL